jgi:hypothetical protein
MHGSPGHTTRNTFILGPGFVRRATPAPVTQRDMAPAGGAARPADAAHVHGPRGDPRARRRRPRLILLAVLDGMRRDYFDRHASVLPTLTRLRKEGAWFANAEVRHLPSITSISHATIATGALPAVHGIVANALFDRISGQPADAYPALSPRLLMALTLADVWNLRTDGRAVIIGQGSTRPDPLARHGACALNAVPSRGRYSEKAELGHQPRVLRPHFSGAQRAALWRGRTASGGAIRSRARATCATRPSSRGSRPRPSRP